MATYNKFWQLFSFQHTSKIINHKMTVNHLLYSNRYDNVEIINICMLQSSSIKGQA